MKKAEAPGSRPQPAREDQPAFLSRRPCGRRAESPRGLARCLGGRPVQARGRPALSPWRTVQSRAGGLIGSPRLCLRRSGHVEQGGGEAFRTLVRKGRTRLPRWWKQAGLRSAPPPAPQRRRALAATKTGKAGVAPLLLGILAGGGAAPQPGEMGGDPVSARVRKPPRSPRTGVAFCQAGTNLWVFQLPVPQVGCFNWWFIFVSHIRNSVEAEAKKKRTKCSLGI